LVSQFLLFHICLVSKFHCKDTNKRVKSKRNLAFLFII
jgi:hypothetical protein